MNRILFEKEEIDERGIASFNDERAEHVLNILHGEVGQILKTGEVNGLCGTSEIVSIDRDKKNITVKTNHSIESLKPWIDIILALPRPRVFKRMLPQLATLGVRHIYVVGTQKVEKAYWGAQYLKDEISRPALIEGLMQGGTSILPKTTLHRNFKYLINSGEFDSRTQKIVAHPGGEKLIRDIDISNQDDLPVVAIGAEGGWTDEEIDFLESKSFTRLSLGQRILRTDTATIAILAILAVNT